MQKEIRLTRLFVLVPPRIRSNDEVESRWVLRGNNISLTCDADAVPPPTIGWFVNGVPLVPSPRIRTQQGGKILFVSFAKVDFLHFYLSVCDNLPRLRLLKLTSGLVLYICVFNFCFGE